MTKRAAIYTRISVSSDDSVSLDVQEDTARHFCAAHSWKVIEPVYIDDGISAFKNVVRPSYERLLKDVQAGLIDVVVVYKLDRFARSSKELVRYLEIFKEHGAVIASVNDSIDTSTATGEAMLTISTAIAQLESENTSRRRQDSALKRARAGQVTKGGRRPFGYKPDRVTLNKREVRLIREAADRFLAGESLRSIAMDWNMCGIKTTTDGVWSGHTIGQCLRSPRLAGYRVHKGVAYKSDVIQPVFSEDEHLRLAAALGDAKRRAPRKTLARHLLSSLLFCQLCGAPMKIRGEDWATNKLRYACMKREDATHCGSVSILAAETEERVFEDLVSMIDSEGLVRVADDVDVATLLAAAEEALREDQARLEQLSKDHYVGSDGFRLSRDEYMASRIPLTERVARLEVDVAGLRRRAAAATKPSVPDSPEALRAWWGEAGLLDKRAFLETVLVKIQVAPVRRRGHNAYDPDRLTYEWRQ